MQTHICIKLLSYTWEPHFKNLVFNLNIYHKSGFKLQIICYFIILYDRRKLYYVTTSDYQTDKQLLYFMNIYDTRINIMLQLEL